MCPSSPSAWQTWSWADPSHSFPRISLTSSKRAAANSPCKKEMGIPERGCLSLFCIILPSMPHRRDGNSHSAPCQPAIDRPSPLRSLRRSASGTAGALCAKIIEACCAQDCRLSQRTEKVLNIMQNAPAKPLCKGRKQPSFLCIACPAALTRCVIKYISAMAISLSFRIARHHRTKNGQTKAGCAPKDTPCQVYLDLTMCAETGAKRPQNAETTQ